MGQMLRDTQQAGLWVWEGAPGKTGSNTEAGRAELLLNASSEAWCWTTAPADLNQATQQNLCPDLNQAAQQNPCPDLNQAAQQNPCPEVPTEAVKITRHLLFSLGSNFAERVNKLEVLICQKL
jgi:hypothetical protein